MWERKPFRGTPERHQCCGEGKRTILNPNLLSNLGDDTANSITHLNGQPADSFLVASSSPRKSRLYLASSVPLCGGTICGAWPRHDSGAAQPRPKWGIASPQCSHHNLHKKFLQKYHPLVSAQLCAALRLVISRVSNLGGSFGLNATSRRNIRMPERERAHALRRDKIFDSRCVFEGRSLSGINTEDSSASVDGHESEAKLFHSSLSHRHEPPQTRATVNFHLSSRPAPESTIKAWSDLVLPQHRLVRSREAEWRGSHARGGSSAR
ncbi:hypothetical protein C8J57DRAFT_1670337 [Mycena rebaudengoi]|nr:hypothetical protein C8J57DRAFT_1670337 [Mycena rebaudengoi]